MTEHAYLNWMAKNTETQWCNDSCIIDEIVSALNSGAIGCTSNPPLTYLSLTQNPELFEDEVNKIPKNISGNEKVVQLIGVVVRHISKMLIEIYEKSNGKYGYIRSQVQPSLSADAHGMLEMGKSISSWGKNVMVKIPGTQAGVWVLEELATLGIPTNPTVCVTLSQMLAVAEAYERGAKRAKRAGITPAPSTAAYVMGRLQDYLAALNKERNAGISTYDLECAVLAVAKRCYRLYIERGYSQIVMPAAFRCARHVEQLVGSNTVMTIHPKIQDEVIKADNEGKIQRKIAIDNPVDEDAVNRVSKAFPEFKLAYELNALDIKDFDSFGATVMTLEGFDITGWQKLFNYNL